MTTVGPNLDFFNSWVQKHYGYNSRTKTITREKYTKICQLIRGESCQVSAKFRYWVRSKGFRLLRQTSDDDVVDDSSGCLFVSLHAKEDSSPAGETSIASFLRSNLPAMSFFRKVAVVEDFYDIIRKAHVDDTNHHAGQKKTYRLVSDLYAFLPREVITFYLLNCSYCKPRIQKYGPNILRSKNSDHGVTKKSRVREREPDSVKADRSMPDLFLGPSHIDRDAKPRASLRQDLKSVDESNRCQDSYVGTFYDKSASDMKRLPLRSRSLQDIDDTYKEKRYFEHGTQIYQRSNMLASDRYLSRNVSSSALRSPLRQQLNDHFIQSKPPMLPYLDSCATERNSMLNSFHLPFDVHHFPRSAENSRFPPFSHIEHRRSSMDQIPPKMFSNALWKTSHEFEKRDSGLYRSMHEQSLVENINKDIHRTFSSKVNAPWLEKSFDVERTSFESKYADLEVFKSRPEVDCKFGVRGKDNKPCRVQHSHQKERTSNMFHSEQDDDQDEDIIVDVISSPLDSSSPSAISPTERQLSSSVTNIQKDRQRTASMHPMHKECPLESFKKRPRSDEGFTGIQQCALDANARISAISSPGRLYSTIVNYDSTETVPSKKQRLTSSDSGNEEKPSNVDHDICGVNTGDVSGKNYLHPTQVSHNILQVPTAKGIREALEMYQHDDMEYGHAPENTSVCGSDRCQSSSSTVSDMSVLNGDSAAQLSTSMTSRVSPLPRDASSNAHLVVVSPMSPSHDMTSARYSPSAGACGRKLSYPLEIDEQLLRWTKEQQMRGMVVTSENLRRQALIMIQPYCVDFKASTGWLDKFLARHKLDLSVNSRGAFSDLLRNGHSSNSPSVAMEDQANAKVHASSPNATSLEVSVDTQQPSKMLYRPADSKDSIPRVVAISSEPPVTVVPLGEPPPQVIPIEDAPHRVMQMEAGQPRVDLPAGIQNNEAGPELRDEDDEDDDEDDDSQSDISEKKPDGVAAPPVNSERLKAFNMFVRLFIDENLDRLVPISKQPKEKVNAIILSCQRQFPEFADRARKRIRTYLKSCRRTNRHREPSKRTADSSMVTHHIPTAQLAEVNNILARACQNESEQAAKRQRLDPLLTNTGLPHPSTQHMRIQHPTQSSSPGPAHLPSPQVHGQHNSQSGRCSHSPASRLQPSTGNVADLHTAALTAAHTQNQIILGPHTTAQHHFLTSLKSPPVKLTHAETAAVRQLINGYRESASFLHRSADELEKLLSQSEKFYAKQASSQEKQVSSSQPSTSSST